MMIFKKTYLFFALPIILSYPFYGFAAQQRVHVPISLEVTGTCLIDTSGINSFGTQPADSQSLKNISLGSLSVNCPTDVKYVIGIDKGLHFEGNQRHMSNGTHEVTYSLWSGDTATATEWGDDGLSEIEPSYIETYPAPAVVGTGTGSPQAYPLWGSVENETAPPGNYEDDVTITIVW
jgi:spore coat protein U-like protein